MDLPYPVPDSLAPTETRKTLLLVGPPRTYQVKIDNLNAGRRYLIVLEPVDSLMNKFDTHDQNEKIKLAKANAQEYTSCT